MSEAEGGKSARHRKNVQRQAYAGRIAKAALDPKRGFSLAKASRHYAGPEFSEAVRWCFSMQGRARIKDGPSAFDLAERATWQRHTRMLLEALREKLTDGDLRTIGFVPGNPAPQEIPPLWWRDATIDGEGGVAEAHGVRFTGILVFPPLTMTVKPKKAAGGRPPSDKWKPFATEMMRVLALDGGDITRTNLKRHMRGWVAEKFEEPPDQRTTERWVDELLPPGIAQD